MGPRPCLGRGDSGWPQAAVVGGYGRGTHLARRRWVRRDLAEQAWRGAGPRGTEVKAEPFPRKAVTQWGVSTSSWSPPCRHLRWDVGDSGASFRPDGLGDVSDPSGPGPARDRAPPGRPRAAVDSGAWRPKAPRRPWSFREARSRAGSAGSAGGGGIGAAPSGVVVCQHAMAGWAGEDLLAPPARHVGEGGGADEA